MTEHSIDQSLLSDLGKQLEGEFYFDETMRRLYATDASAYREMPLAVALPKNDNDLKRLIAFANKNGVGLIPRTAGTSLAGQVVGNGIVVDVSKYYDQILEVNEEERWVRLQPGVVRDDLNHHLKKYNLYFGPETSTANRAMLGGMVGNNSCGSNSVVYGSTREHLISAKVLLSDGTDAEFKALSTAEFQDKCLGKSTVSEIERNIYAEINAILESDENQKLIRDTFPNVEIPRRNTGYALDLLMNTEPFDSSGRSFNFCQLLAGSEGTLAFITELKMQCVPPPPKDKLLVCAHFEDLYESLEATLIALKYNPLAVELMDHYVLECTKTNIEQSRNRFFVEGDPAAILMIELSRESFEGAQKAADDMIEELKTAGYGYHFPVITGPDTKKVFTLRKAGLGLLSNMPGDAKPAPVIEDTAVDVRDLPAYIKEFNGILKKHGLYSVHYAHAGSGELHLRPILNLKTREGNAQFRTIAEEIAALVKRYKGSLSGEHGDGRLRGEFIKYMIGEKSYALLKKVKNAFDPHHIFNPNKIVDTPPMDTFLRYVPGQETKKINTTLNFEDTQGIIRAAELCNGSGDCRKTHIGGGTMCPSYMATRNEKETTRARANIIREILTNSQKQNPFDSEQIKEVMDLCLSCKGCKSECPSNVDIGKLKAEFLHQYYNSNGIPLRTRLIGYYTKLTQLASIFPWIYNTIFGSKIFGPMARGIIGFARDRSMPHLYATTLRSWYKKNKSTNFGVAPLVTKKSVYLFCDEFTNFNDTPIGQKAIMLLTRLGYGVQMVRHEESGRAFLSKGMLTQAKSIAEKNIEIFHPLISEDTPLIGIEPSAILGFRDEYISLTRGETSEKARQISVNTFLIDEFINQEMESGNIDKALFDEGQKLIKLHGHCHQKSLASVVPTKKMLSFPKNYTVEMIPSGCCGMAGSFGYEKEHYDLSMKVGELVLFPTVRKQKDDVIISAPGTSCRHQIKDGTSRIAMHPIEILWDALK